MITKTDKFKVKIVTPLDFEVGEIHTYHEGDMWHAEDYPDVFEPIYKLEDGTELCLGDMVWRSKNYEVKSTPFSKIHIEQDTPIFGTREACERWLEKNAENIKTELLKQNKDSSFQSLKSWVSRLNNLEELSWSDLNKIRNGLQTCIKNIEEI